MLFCYVDLRGAASLASRRFQAVSFLFFCVHRLEDGDAIEDANEPEGPSAKKPTTPVRKHEDPDCGSDGSRSR